MLATLNDSVRLNPRCFQLVQECLEYGIPNFYKVEQWALATMSTKLVRAGRVMPSKRLHILLVGANATRCFCNARAARQPRVPNMSSMVPKCLYSRATCILTPRTSDSITRSWLAS
eukprot:3796397-Pyramimonas_sp.AAC.1